MTSLKSDSAAYVIFSYRSVLYEAIASEWLTGTVNPAAFQVCSIPS
jgi:hypothetical protein